MSLASADLPSDPDALGAFALACQNELAAATAELQAAKLAVQLRTLEIEKLKFQIARLRRMQFGRSSERLARHIEQLELRLEELEAGEAEEISKTAAEDQPFPIREADRPKRKPLPDHLPRHAIVHEPVHDGACTCPACGGDMARLGEDVTEVLDYIPGRFRVIRHVRPKYACRRCDAITQAPAPSLGDLEFELLDFQGTQLDGELCCLQLGGRRCQLILTCEGERAPRLRIGGQIGRGQRHTLPLSNVAEGNQNKQRIPDLSNEHGSRRRGRCYRSPPVHCLERPPTEMPLALTPILRGGRKSRSWILDIRFIDVGSGYCR